ncbi:MAG: hypothetical protein ABFS19_13235 [Thermodesulfobacteriota bacterium]
MNFADRLGGRRLLLLLILLFCFPAYGWAADDEFSFEIEELEKKPLEWGGYSELKWEHMDINQDSPFTLLNLSDDPPSSLDRLGASVQLDGSYLLGISSFHWTLKAAASQDDIGWADTADVYEAYAALKASPNITASIGKKAYKWGKGYAWNPVGFINRPKDPNNPEESLEGYVTVETDLVKSSSGFLQTTALTAVLLPVVDDINEDFGEIDNTNLAAKLYFLILDTDIDLLLLTGNSRPVSYGFDFSKNLATNFEIHGEIAWRSDQKKAELQDDNSLAVEEEDALSWLVGIRYLSTSDITSIIEYYHNDRGYSEAEMSRFYSFADEAETQYRQTASRLLLDRTREMSMKGYGRPQPGRNYLYGRFSQKEPFDILYLTPALTGLVNLDDNSYSLTPELIYSGFTNWEMRLRFSVLNGGTHTEYGEKQNSNKLELRLRYFF